MRLIDVEPYAGTHRHGGRAFSRDFFSVNVDRLPGFAEAAWARATVAHHMRRDLDILTVSKFLDAQVARRRDTAYLHMQGSDEKDRAKGKAASEPDAPLRE